MPIRIDVLRHGIAEPFHEEGDHARPLTREGETAIEALAARLKVANWRPDRAYSSPFRRAQQTMALMIERAELPLSPQLMSELEHESTPPDLELALLPTLGQARHVLLVSHQPLVGLLAHHWTGTRVPFAPGDLLGIEFSSTIARGAGRIVERISSQQ